MHPNGRPLTLLGMTTRRLCRRPMRSALTALGVAIGVVAIVAVNAVGFHHAVASFWASLITLFRARSGYRASL